MKSLFSTLIYLVLCLGYAFGELDDGHCCRKRIECYDCDSRIDPRCGDTFNLTRDTGTLVSCNDLCIKLKHKFGNQFYYVRSCADRFKKILLKKTEVCYTTRTKENGQLCFCDEDLCNTAAASPFSTLVFGFVTSLLLLASTSAIFLL